MRLLALKLVVAWTLVGNVVDASLTIVWTSTGAATEANPLLDEVLARSPILFMAAKLALVSAGVYLLFQRRKRRLALAGLYTCGGVYAALVAYHLIRFVA